MVEGRIDFYHAAKQLSDAVKLRRWSATKRTRWLNRTRGLLKRARVDEVITALRELCRGRTAGKIRTHLNYFLKNRHRFAYTTMVGLGLPRGSGAVESAIRRVINLRIKGASIYWLPESVDAILLLRSFYKSGLGYPLNRSPVRRARSRTGTRWREGPPGWVNSPSTMKAVRYQDLIASHRPRTAPPTPPRVRGYPPSLARPPANRLWTTTASGNSGYMDTPEVR